MYPTFKVGLRPLVHKPFIYLFFSSILLTYNEAYKVKLSSLRNPRVLQRVDEVKLKDWVKWSYLIILHASNTIFILIRWWTSLPIKTLSLQTPNGESMRKVLGWLTYPLSIFILCHLFDTPYYMPKLYLLTHTFMHLRANIAFSCYASHAICFVLSHMPVLHYLCIIPCAISPYYISQLCVTHLDINCFAW